MAEINELAIYQVTLTGHLGYQWADWFGGMTITLQDNGDTLLNGPIRDQAALHALLTKVRDLGLPLVSVIRVQLTQELAASPRTQEQSISTVIGIEK